MLFPISLFITCVVLCFLSSHDAASFMNPKPTKTEVKFGNFSWQNCSITLDPIQIKSITVGPDPLILPGNVTISTAFSVFKVIPTDVALSIVLEKKVTGFYVKIPCIDNTTGSCTYANFCADWATACPKYFEKFGLPCTCPFPVGNYSIFDAVVPRTKHWPSGFDGDYRITGNFISPSADHLGCFQLHLTAMFPSE